MTKIDWSITDIANCNAMKIENEKIESEKRKIQEEIEEANSISVRVVVTFFIAMILEFLFFCWWG